MLKWLRRRTAESKKKWESHCKKCGICCYEKHYTPSGRLYIDFNAPCMYLNLKNNTCAVYDKRFSVCVDCKKLTIFHAMFSGYLPDSCGYVEKYRKLRFFSKSYLFKEKAKK
ncbi:MAG: hypothetical protein AB1798_01580 [Spirochaetota bacterium]